MKKIYLARHAKAKKDCLDGDFQRPLSKKGKLELELLMPSLKNHLSNLELIIASAAKRTSQSATIIFESLNLKNLKIIYEKKLYEANAKELFGFLQTLNDDLKEVLIMGHNPAIKELCELLCDICLNSFPTSSILGLEFEIDTFKELKEHEGKIVFFEKIKV